MRTVIFANGNLSDGQAVRAAIRPDDVLVAADGGARHCAALGLSPAVVIGDFDSIEPEFRRRLEGSGALFVLYPRDKDQTDLELALAYAIEQGSDDILLVGILGGRLDQTLANLMVLSRPEWKSSRLTVLEGPDRAYLLREGDAIQFEGQKRDVVSLIPLTPTVTVVSTQGLRWPLENDVLEFGSTRGVSNEMTGPSASVRIGGGQLLVVHRSETVN